MGRPRLYIGGSVKKGGTLWPIVRLLKGLCNVKCVEYGGERSGVYLGHNTLKLGVSSKLRRVIFLGGARPGDHGIPREFNWNKADHNVFISKFFRKIAKSRYKIKRSSVIHLVGGAPMDMDLTPMPPVSEPLGDEIHFMISAKWKKRYFKRYKQHIKFFQKKVLPAYPQSKLHVLGSTVTEDQVTEGSITFYKKSFHNEVIKEVYQKSHIQLIFTPFDTGPMTVNESLHYRVPFLCGNNSAANEFISMVDGTCGEIIQIDPQIKTAKDCKKYKPMKDRKFYNRIVDVGPIMETVHKVIKDYPKYTSWNWTEKFNYKAQADKWMNLLFG